MAKAGQFTWTGDEPTFTVHVARYRFLRILDEVCPEPREELVGKVASAYRQMFQTLGEREQPLPVAPADADWDTLYCSNHFIDWLDHPGHDLDPVIEPFLLAVKKWVERYHLKEQWLVDAIIRTVRALESGLDWSKQPNWILRAPDLTAPLYFSDDLSLSRP